MTWKKCLPTQGEEGIGRKTDFFLRYGPPFLR